MINADLSAGATVTNLGSSFLERLGNQASNGFNRMSRNNPGGGGASEATEAPRFRTWFEGYGISARNDAIGDFVGDRRKTFGGVAGFGARLAPGVNVGFSVDQSHTDIDVPLALQSATIDLTQFGFNASVDKGPWTWAIALVHGFGKINSSRDTGAWACNRRLQRATRRRAERNQLLLDKDQSRLVPKAAFEYVRARTGSFQEIGGLDPVMATGATRRADAPAGRGRGRALLDLRPQDSRRLGLWQIRRQPRPEFQSDITVSLGSQSITLQGIGESRYGADAGAAASLSLTNTARSTSTTTPNSAPRCSRTRERSASSSSGSGPRADPGS